MCKQIKLYVIFLGLALIQIQTSAQHSLELSARAGMGLEGKYSIRNTELNYGLGLCYSKQIKDKVSLVASLGRYYATLPDGYLKHMHWTVGGAGLGVHFGALPSKVEWRTQLLLSRFYSMSEVPFKETLRELSSNWVQLGVLSSVHYAIGEKWRLAAGIEVFPGNSIGRSDAISVAFVQGTFLVFSKKKT